MQANDTSSTAPSQKRGADDWPALVTRIIDDLTRIIQTEIGLFHAGLEPIVSSAIDRLVIGMAALVALVLGAICLLGALTVYLHYQLGWAAALAVAGAASVVAGLAGGYIARRRGGLARGELERTFGRGPARSRNEP